MECFPPEMAFRSSPVCLTEQGQLPIWKHPQSLITQNVQLSAHYGFSECVLSHSNKSFPDTVINGSGPVSRVLHCIYCTNKH